LEEIIAAVKGNKRRIMEHQSLSFPKRIQRQVEARVGIPLADRLAKTELRRSKLVGPKQVYLPKFGIPMNYYERKAVTEEQYPPTILLCHGIGSSATEFCTFLRLLDIPPHVRILAPDQIGHGQDLKRAFAEGDAFEQPDATALLESTSEFLDAMNVGPNCNALGTSLGGALVYYLRAKRPDSIQKTVLLAPALLCCLSDPFLLGLVEGKHGFMDFRSRRDVKDLFRNFLWTSPRSSHQPETSPRNPSSSAAAAARPKPSKKKDPFPKVAYEVIYRLWQRDVPPGHHKALQDNLLLKLGLGMNGGNKMESGADGGGIRGTAPPENSSSSSNSSIFTATSDLDPHSPRLLVWPEEDQICSPQRANRFFGSSIASGTTILKTIPNCGHVFHANGTNIYPIVAPMVKDFLLDFGPRSQ